MRIGNHLLAMGLATSLVLVMATNAHAGCPINITFKNAGVGDLSISGHAMKMRTKSGKIWKTMKMNDIGDGVEKTGIDLAPGQSRSLSVNAALGCDLQRQYRFDLVCYGDPFDVFTERYPADYTAYTKSTDIVINIKRCTKPTQTDRAGNESDPNKKKKGRKKSSKALGSVPGAQGTPAVNAPAGSKGKNIKPK